MKIKLIWVARLTSNFIFFTCFNSSILLAQAQVEISGQVKDAKTKKPLEFCSVSVFNTKDSMITGSATDNKGFFMIPLDRGNYRFIVSYMGYKTDTTEITSVTENKFLRVFKLEQDAKFLKEIIIKAGTRENLIDRDIHIVTEKLRTGASDTKDVLDKLNGVKYDGFNNSIKVDGSDKVIILVDGLEKDQEYIKNLSPARLQKIEIIRDPGGRYAFEGYSAVINIILKKDYQGTELYSTEQLTIAPDDGIGKYLHRNSFSTSFNYTYNKVNFYAKYNSFYSIYDWLTSNKKEYNNGLVFEKNPMNDIVPNYKKQFLTNRYTFGNDYYINPRHTISFENGLTTQPSNTTERIYNAIYSKNENIIEHFTVESKIKQGRINSYNSLFYSYNLNEKNTLNLDFTYSYSNINYTNSYKEDLRFKSIENGTSINHNTKFHSEYNHTFNNKASLQIGYGNTWKKINTNYNDVLVSQFEYKDIRHNVYAYYSWQQNDKLSVKIGGASETSSPEASGQKKSYLIFQPYTDIQYKPFGFLNFTLKYRTWTDYPDIGQTNPFTNTIDRQSVSVGNPNLKPETMYHVSLKTNILDGLVTIEPYYRLSNNYIAQIVTLRNDSVFQYSYDNIGKYTEYGVQVNFTIPVGKTLSFQSDFSPYKNSMYYVGKIKNIEDWSMRSRLKYSNQKSGTSVELEYQKGLTKKISVQGYTMNGDDYWAVLIYKVFLKKRLNLRVSYVIPITWGVNYKAISYKETDTYRENLLEDMSGIKNWVVLKATYRFNKGKSINKIEKNIERE